MKIRILAAAFCIGFSLLLVATDVDAQNRVSAIALKSGESTEMGPVYWIKRGANCQSTLLKIEGV